MSMSTVYVVIGIRQVGATGPVDVCWVAQNLDATQAVKELSLWCTPPGEIYACKLSDSAAAEIRDLTMSPDTRPMPRGSARVSALTLLKRYSQSMQKVADLT